ncbi:MAG: type II toxin-antitoxin system RelE/ParE family toxin [Coriobacteriales bacterium]|jgi:mRNA interferase RelE/StbE|nr:type II toxin-antitoxin system RelE/ParE family toxin [Coriobacteriales bacterium]
MYTVRLSQKAVEAVARLDVSQRRIISRWVEKHLEGCVDPRASGKALQGPLKGLWRYRVGDYRLIAQIHDQEVYIEIVNIGHRRQIYSR